MLLSSYSDFKISRKFFLIILKCPKHGGHITFKMKFRVLPVLFFINNHSQIIFPVSPIFSRTKQNSLCFPCLEKVRIKFPATHCAGSVFLSMTQPSVHKSVVVLRKTMGLLVTLSSRVNHNQQTSWIHSTQTSICPI